MNDLARPQPVKWHWSRKALISVLVSWHLLAVFIAPFTFATATLNPRNEPSPFANLFMTGMKPYVDVMYLNHGYFFFAPEPGPSHLMRFESKDDKDSVMFPDRQKQWPRLLYHRHFMLSESINNTAPPVDAEMAIRREQPDNPSLLIYDRMVSSFENHVQVEFELESPRITRVRHSIPNPEQLRDLLSLKHPQLYSDLIPSEPMAPPQGGQRE